MQKPTICLEDVRWRETGLGPVMEPWSLGEDCPVVGEIRWVLINNGVSYRTPLGQKQWLLFRPGAVYYNSWETTEEIAASALIEIEFLEEGPRHFLETDSKNVFHWAKVSIQKVTSLNQIKNQFPESQPSVWPHENAEVQIFRFNDLVFYWLIHEGFANWFITTNTEPQRMILRCHSHGWDEDETIEICNCLFDPTNWPHRVRGESN